MGKFRSDNKNRFQGRFNDNRSRGRFEERDNFRARSPRRFEKRPSEMHDVVCDKCGKQCQVPFRPSGDKPVLCSECFNKNKNSANNFSSRNQDSFSQPGQSGISSEQFNQINKKLDKILLVLQDLELEVEDDDFEDEDEEDEDDSEEDSEDSEKDNSK